MGPGVIGKGDGKASADLAGSLLTSMPASQVFAGSDRLHPNTTGAAIDAKALSGFSKIDAISRQLGLQGSGLEALNALSSYYGTSENTPAVDARSRSDLDPPAGAATSGPTEAQRAQQI